VIAAHRLIGVLAPRGKEGVLTGSNPVAPTVSQTQIPPLVAEATGDGI
jgi:hypothetical protein